MKKILISILSLISIVSCFSFKVLASVVPAHETIHSKSGIPIYFFPSPVGVFEVILSFDSGSERDPLGKSGLNYYLSQAVHFGAGNLNEKQLSEAADDIAAGMSSQVGDERLTFEAFGLTKDSKNILDLFFKTLKEPTYPEEPFLRFKANHIDSIRQNLDSAPALASIMLDLGLLNGTAKGRPVGGFLRDVKTMTVQDLKSARPRVLRTDRLKILVIGGESQKEVVDPLLKHLDSWTSPFSGAEVSPAVMEPRNRLALKPGSVVVVDRPGITEAHLRIGFLGPARNNPQYFDLEVAEAILGGTYGSRLNQAVREKKNLSYAVGASFNYSDSLSTFVVSSSTRNAAIGSLIHEIRRTMNAFIYSGEISDEELSVAKNYLVGAFPLLLQNRYSIARLYFNSLLEGLNDAFLDQYRPGIEAVTMSSLKSAISKHFHWDQAVTVVVGDLKKIRKPLEEAGISFSVRNAVDYL